MSEQKKIIMQQYCKYTDQHSMKKGGALALSLHFNKANLIPELAKRYAGELFEIETGSR